jgi:hypothetical protein
VLGDSRPIVLSDWFKKKRPATSLSEAAAVEIARQAVEERDRRFLSMVTLEERSGKLTWIVSTAGVGTTVTVLVDDATGAVVEKHRHSGR